MPVAPVDKLAQWWLAASNIAILTGAGMSAESGVPTFRGAGSGLWSRFDPGALASPGAFRANPDLVWGWYQWRRAVIQRAQPNAGHRALAALERLRGTLAVITQNVDDLHERAGSRNVIHLHGELFRTICSECGVPVPDAPVSAAMADNPEQRLAPPRCQRCGGAARPDVTWFGEPLPEPAIDAAYVLARTCDLLVVVGTSGHVAPASVLPAIVNRRGGCVVEINPEATWLTSEASLAWRSTAAVALPTLFARLSHSATR